MLAADCVFAVARALPFPLPHAASETAAALAAIPVNAESAPGSASDAATELCPASAALALPSGGSDPADPPLPTTPTTLLHVALRSGPAPTRSSRCSPRSRGRRRPGRPGLAALPLPSSTACSCAAPRMKRKRRKWRRRHQDEVEGEGRGGEAGEGVGVTAAPRRGQLLADTLVEAAEGGEVQTRASWSLLHDDERTKVKNNDGSDESDKTTKQGPAGTSVAASWPALQLAAGTGEVSAADLFAARAFSVRRGRLCARRRRQRI